MASIVDSFQYPWHLRDARELHMVLARLYPSAKGASFAAEQAGVDALLIDPNQPPYMVWKDIVDLAATTGLLRALVQVAYDQHKNSPRGAFLEALLNDKAPVHDSEPRGLDGAPAFRNGSDNITTPEALLFHDDLTLPIGRVAWLIAALQKLQTLAPSVCRFTSFAPGVLQRGTGFRIAEEWLLTNEHVLYFDKTVCTRADAEFGFDDDGKNGGLPSRSYSCDVTTIVADAANDWAVIRTNDPLPASIPILKLSEHVVPAMNEAAFLIQHPGGERKRIAYARNQITFFDDRVLHYLSDTQEGSSGAPVLNDQGLLIGLHHAGGRPQEVAGKPPLVKNEGIRIPKVIEGLQQANVPFA
ncbi:MAG TPA: serine protease [Thermoanaerobaculia bacterium]|nr:serine protease [Thermoanaerobaculia bacterium]